MKNGHGLVLSGTRRETVEQSTITTVGEEMKSDLQELATENLDAFPAELAETTKDARQTIKESIQETMRSHFKKLLPSYTKAMESSQASYVKEGKKILDDLLTIQKSEKDRLTTNIEDIMKRMEKETTILLDNIQKVFDKLEAKTTEASKTSAEKEKEDRIDEDMSTQITNIVNQLKKELKGQLEDFTTDQRNAIQIFMDKMEVKNEGLQTETKLYSETAIAHVKTTIDGIKEDCKEKLDDFVSVKRKEIQKTGTEMKQVQEETAQTIHKEIATEAAQQAGIEANRLDPPQVLLSSVMDRRYSNHFPI